MKYQTSIKLSLRAKTALDRLQTILSKDKKASLSTIIEFGILSLSTYDAQPLIDAYKSIFIEDGRGKKAT